MKQKTHKKPLPGRPLQGNKKRERVSFTLHPEQIKWIRHQESIRHEYKSQILEQVIREAQERWQETLPSKFPFPKIFVPYEEIKKICEREKIRKLSLFGSVLTDYFNANSDIDVLVEFFADTSPTIFQLIRIEKEIEEIFGGRKVDLKTSKELSSHFRKDILREAFVIYEER